MAEEITAATRLVIVCNPNNPTSTALPIDEIADFVRGVPRHVAVILDEAYVEFNVLQDPDESVALLDRHPNLVLLRTFSKIYGLCGLRVGYALCGSESFRDGGRPGAPAVLLQRGRQAAALEASNHTDEVTRRVERNLAERMGLEEGLRELGHRAGGLAGELRLVRPGRGARRGRRHARLAERGILVGRHVARVVRARCGSRSARRPRTSGSWKRWPRCCKLARAETPARRQHLSRWRGSYAYSGWRFS